MKRIHLCIFIFLNVFLGIEASASKYGRNDTYQAWKLNNVASSSSSNAAGKTSNTDSKFKYVRSFHSSASLTDNKVGLNMHWTINKVTNKIRLAIACLEAKGWVGIGFTEMGGMPGADMVIFEVRDTKLYDAYAVAFERPQIDPHQDWTLLNSIVEDDDDGNRLIIFEIERDLDTNDDMDHPFHDDTNLMSVGTRMIAAWGDTEEMHYHGPDNRLQANVRLFSDSDIYDGEIFKRNILSEAEGSVLFNFHNFIVPPGTTYQSSCFTVSDGIQRQGLTKNKPLHLIGFEVKLDPGSYIHHILLYQDTKENFSGCLPEDDGPNSIALLWTRGQSRFVSFPDDVGVLLADESSRNGKGLGIPPKSFRLEIHYENPHEKIKKGVIDSSGLKLYYTSNLRKYTAATMEFADPHIILKGRPIGQGLQKHTFDCPSSCTQSHLPSGGVTVFNQFLHMHTKGLTMEIVHKRNGKELHVSRVEYFSFEYGAQVTNDEYQVLPGDTFETRCVYEGDKNTQFGFRAKNEMCLGAVYYYPSSLSAHMMCTPKSDVKGCGVGVSEYSRESLSSYSELNRTFGVIHQDDVDTQKEKTMMQSESQDQEQHDTEAVRVMSFLILTIIIVVISCLLFRKIKNASWCRKDAKSKYARVDTDE